jgi:hypothetical protein
MEYTSEVTESLEECNIRLVSPNINTPSEEQIKEIIKEFPDRDTLIVDIILDSGEANRFKLDDSLDYTELKSSIETLVEIKDDSSIFTVGIKIRKRTDQRSRISIYRFESLLSYLEQQTLRGIVYCFREALGQKEHIIFELMDIQDTFYTGSFYFTSNDRVETTEIGRESKILKRYDICTFLNASECKFVAEDFHLVKRSRSEAFNKLMDKLTIIYALISICNISGFEGVNELWCRIYGYKSLVNTINYDEMSVDGASQYFEIHKWLYNEGNLSDKAGLVRNIITIHLRNNSLLELEDNTLASIRSSHEIYLKQNVQQYIEVKNKIVESLNDMAQKAGGMVDTFTGTLKNNFLGIITFFVSTVVLNAVSGEEDGVIFSTQIAMISYGLLLISGLFLIASIWEIIQDINRFKNNYKRIRSYYGDILNDGDIEKIFCNDRYHKEDISYVWSKTKFYSAIWVITLIVFYLIIYKSSNLNPLGYIIELFK